MSSTKLLIVVISILTIQAEYLQEFKFLTKEECGDELVKEDDFMKDMIADTPGGGFNR